MAKIPTIIKHNIDSYVEYGYSPGGFCEAVLCDKLQEALQRADLECRKALPDIVAYVNSVVPRDARGSEEAIRMWPSILRKRRQDPRNG
jgi:hypothetical protein